MIIFQSATGHCVTSFFVCEVLIRSYGQNEEWQTTVKLLNNTITDKDTVINNCAWNFTSESFSGIWTLCQKTNQRSLKPLNSKSMICLKHPRSS